MNKYLLTTYSYLDGLEGKTEIVEWECSNKRYILYHDLFLCSSGKNIKYKI